MTDPLEPFLAGGGTLVLDGGLATELERAGFDLDHPLWSARLLRKRPEAIADVHRAYLEAGADCITTASYQATTFGFRRDKATAAEAVGLLWLSVELALRVRDAFCSDAGGSVGPAGSGPSSRPASAPMVRTGPTGRSTRAPTISTSTGSWTSIGRGCACCSKRARTSWPARPSRPRSRRAPSPLLLAELRDARAWVSFSCRDGSRLCDGTPFVDAVRTVAAVPQVAAVGVNCTAPRFVEDLLRAAAAVTDKPLVAYPNSGETYDAAAKAWRGTSDPLDWGERARAWRAAGARLVGGCCRTGPDHVRAVRAALGS